MHMGVMDVCTDDGVTVSVSSPTDPGRRKPTAGTEIDQN